ncbi:MAG: hypothetical protein PVTTEEND_001037 [Candidatus Fervidibacter sp.]
MWSATTITVGCWRMFSCGTKRVGEFSSMPKWCGTGSLAPTPNRPMFATLTCSFGCKRKPAKIGGAYGRSIARLAKLSSVTTTPAPSIGSTAHWRGASALATAFAFPTPKRHCKRASIPAASANPKFVLHGKTLSSRGSALRDARHHFTPHDRLSPTRWRRRRPPCRPTWRSGWAGDSGVDRL